MKSGKILLILLVLLFLACRKEKPEQHDPIPSKGNAVPYKTSVIDFTDFPGEYDQIENPKHPAITLLWEEGGREYLMIRGNFTNFNHGKIRPDSYSYRLYAVKKSDSEYKIVGYYDAALGNIRKWYYSKNLLFLVESYYRGGSGGGDYHGIIKVIRIGKEKPFTPLFDEIVSYRLDMKSSVPVRQYDCIFSIENDDLNLEILPEKEFKKPTAGVPAAQESGIYQAPSSYFQNGRGIHIGCLEKGCDANSAEIAAIRSKIRPE